MDHKADLVFNSSLGLELSTEEGGILSGLMRAVDLVDGDYLIEEGTTDNALHVVATGKLEVVKKSGTGDVASLAVLREGDIAGELSFIDGQQHTVGLRALCDSHVLSLDRESFESIVDEHPQLVYKVMRAIALSTHRIVHRMNLDFIELNNYIFKQHGRY